MWGQAAGSIEDGQPVLPADQPGGSSCKGTTGGVPLYWELHPWVSHFSGHSLSDNEGTGKYVQKVEEGRVTTFILFSPEYLLLKYVYVPTHLSWETTEFK